DGNKAQVWDVLSGQALTPWLEHPDPPHSAAFRSDGQRVVIGAGNPGVVIGTGKAEPEYALHVWAVPSGKKVCTLEGTKTECHEIRGTFTPDGKRILALRRWQRDRVTAAAEAGIWDAETGKRLSSLHSYTGFEESLAGWPENSYLSKDGQRVVTLSRMEMWVWDA